MRIRTLGLGLLATAFLVFLNFRGHVDTDTCVFRTGALLAGPNLYDLESQQATQPGKPLIPFFRAPFYAAILRLFLFPNFDLAWLLLRIAAVFGFMYLLSRLLAGEPWWVPWLALVFFPLRLSFEIHQDGVLMLCVLTGALLLEQRGRPGAAGLLLALTLQKPTLMTLLPLVMLVQRRWKMLAGYCAGGLTLAVASVWIIGVEAIRDYYHLVEWFEHSFFRMPTAVGVAAALDLPLLVLPLTLFAIIAVYLVCRRSDFPTAFCCGIVASVFVSPQSFQHDLAMLALPVIYLSMRGKHATKWASIAMLFPPLAYLYDVPPPYTALNGSVVLAYLTVLAWGSVRMPAPAVRAPRQALSPESSATP